MTQQTLFDGSDLVTHPRSRKTDHDSSREAARKHAPRAESSRAIVLAGVKEYPGKTSKELAFESRSARFDGGWRETN